MVLVGVLGRSRRRLKEFSRASDAMWSIAVGTAAGELVWIPGSTHRKAGRFLLSAAAQRGQTALKG